MAFGRTATPLEHLLVSRRRLRRLSLISLQTGTPYFLNPTASRPLIFRETIKKKCNRGSDRFGGRNLGRSKVPFCVYREEYSNF